jgi:hypothetical protein
MTPKEKAEELIDKFTFEIGNFNAKQSALIAVREILDNNNNLLNTFSQNDYWLQVKQEIEKL